MIYKIILVHELCIEEVSYFKVIVINEIILVSELSKNDINDLKIRGK